MNKTKKSIMFAFLMVLTAVLVSGAVVIKDTGYMSAGTWTINETPDFWFYGDGNTASNDTSNFNLVSVNDDDGTGALSRVSLNMYSGGVAFPTNYALGIQAHTNTTTQPRHITFYSDLTNSSTSEKVIEWQWGPSSTGILEIPILNRIELGLSDWTGYYQNETAIAAGLQTNNDNFIVVIDDNSISTSEKFSIAFNSNEAEQFLVTDDWVNSTGQVHGDSLGKFNIQESVYFPNNLARGIYTQGTGDLVLGIGGATWFYLDQSLNKIRLSKQLDLDGQTAIDFGELEVDGISGDGAGKAVCIKGDGNLGTCSDAVGAGGTCTCT